MAAFTFDPANKSATVTLSGGNLVATLSSSPGSARSVLSTGSGGAGQKLYAEFKITGTLAGAMAVGLHTTPYPVDNTAIGATANTYAYNSNGGRYDSGVFTGGWGAAYGILGNDIISVLFDVDAQNLVVWKNGTTQGTLNTAPITGTEYLGLSLYAADIVTLNAGGSAFVYTPPVGYTGWTIPDPTPGIGTATLQTLTGSGSRIAAGAGTMQAITGAGGYNGIGTATIEQFTATGAGGPDAGAVTLGTLTASGTGYQATRGDATIQVLTASATGYDSAIWMLSSTAPAPRLSSTGFAGKVITFSGAAPTPTLECHTKDAVLTAPVPTLNATLLAGVVITVTARAAAPVLVAALDNPSIITASLAALPPRLSAALVAGQLITTALTTRAPILSSTALTGNVATVLATAATPIMAAAGYPAYTITMGLTAPSPRLSATLSEAVAAAYRTFVLNTRKLALSEYGPEWAMNSYCIFQGKVLGCTSSGVIELGTQDLDGVTDIAATVTTGKDSFGSSVLKRVPRIYIGHTAAGDLRFSTITTEGGTRQYALNWNSVTGVQMRRVPIGKGPKSRFWQFSVTNVGGADFSINDILAYPTKLRRRVQ